MRIWCGRILATANYAQPFGTGRRKRSRLRRTESASSAGGERRCRPRGQSFCGRRDCADAAQARRRGRGRYSAPVHAPACADGCTGLRRAQRRWRSGGETVPANAPRATAGCIGPKAERTDAKSRAPLSGRPRRQSSDCRGGRTQRGVRFSRGSTVGPMQPADSGTATRTERLT